MSRDFMTFWETPFPNFSVDEKSGEYDFGKGRGSGLGLSLGRWRLPKVWEAVALWHNREAVEWISEDLGLVLASNLTKEVFPASLPWMSSCAK